MYLQNKYTVWYYKIITRAQQRINLTGYFERHHIIPKCLGGDNSEYNLVSLTAKEHFICHLLLVKMTTGKNKSKMANAARGLSRRKNPYQQERYKVNSRIYEFLKKNVKQSEESNEKRRLALTGIKRPLRTPEHSAKLGKYIRNDAHRKAISEMRKQRIGKYKHSEETKEKMSEWQKGIPKPKQPCEVCGKEISLLNYKRWHGQRCKG